jgi:hypothetical protein
MVWRSRLGSAVLFTLLALALGGCKYSFTGASVQPDVKTFSLPQFDNIAGVVNPTLANRITETLRDRFQQQSRLNLVPRNGDLVLSGTVTEYAVSPIAPTAGQQAARNRLTIRCKVSFENTKYPDQNWEQTFENFADFENATPLPSVEGTLVAEITDKIVQDIVNKALSDW